MKKFLAVGFLALSALAAHAEYEQVNLTVFGIACAPCAHAINVSMKGIQGVNTVDIDLNTGLVSIKLTPGNSAAMRQFNEAVEKNGFTHKDARVVRGLLSGSAQAPLLEVTGTKDRYALTPLAGGTDISGLLGKTVVVDGIHPQSGKGKVADVLRYKSVTETKMTMTANSQAPRTTCETGCTSQLLFSLQFVQHPNLLCAAFSTGSAGAGDYSCLAAIGCPWLVSLSRHKIWTSSIAGLLIAMSFVTTYLIAPRLQQGEVCYADDPITSGEVSKVSRIILWGSAVIWSCGFFVAYLLGPILEGVDR